VSSLQIREVPDDFFVDIVSQDNFLVASLSRLFNALEHGENVDER